jgi:hypothetical protein
MLDRAFHLEPVAPPDQVVERAHAQLRHELPHFLRDEPHEVHHMLRFAPEILPQLGVLRGHAHRAGVQVASAHHDAAH